MQVFVVVCFRVLDSKTKVVSNFYHFFVVFSYGYLVSNLDLAALANLELPQVAALLHLLAGCVAMLSHDVVRCASMLERCGLQRLENGETCALMFVKSR